MVWAKTKTLLLREPELSIKLVLEWGSHVISLYQMGALMATYKWLYCDLCLTGREMRQTRAIKEI